MNNFRIDKPFERNLPRLKDLVNEHVMVDVWPRDSTFGSITNSLKITEHFDMKHHNILRAIDKCTKNLGTELKFELRENLVESSHLSGP
jgi:phage regulator Rha-like protein